ncbi:MAG: efflux RND transporter periplasmic adaptor subunit [Candidatus Omnitrophica bacterium]|nr:efflux RND transporter periplasmic adaptor subunit [Candidatus Omnitrophota bacterium]
MQKSKIKNQKYNTKFKSFGFCFVILIFAFCILNFLAGCQQKKVAQNAQEAIPVRVSKITLQDFAETIDYVGNIKAQDEAIVYPKVSGKIIAKIRQDNEPIKKGEAICYIDRDEVGLKFEPAPVESPIDGIVGRVYVDIGENVSSQTEVALVVAMQQVKIRLDIPEKYLTRIALAQVAKIRTDAYPDAEFSGEVTKISPVVDLATRTFPVEITVDNPQLQLKPGMFAKVSLILEEYQNVPVILKEAVLGREPNWYVYVVENNKAVLREITLGLRQGPYYQVRSGLKEGDYVVIVGQQRLYAGAGVTVEEENGGRQE